MRYGPRWKRDRQIFHNQFNLTIKAHRMIQVPIAQELLQKLYKFPDAFLDNLEQ